MSAATGRVHSVTVDDVLREIEARGVRVVEHPLPSEFSAAYHRRSRQVFVQPDLPRAHMLPTLLHEAEHVCADHDGHQSHSVERAINERVAAVLISPAEYMLAESLHAGHTGAIASELDLPRWVVSAYRAPLWRGKGGINDSDTKIGVVDV